MSDFTCRECGREFSLPDAVRERYPNWTPPLCLKCKDGRGGERSRRPEHGAAGEGNARPDRHVASEATPAGARPLEAGEGWADDPALQRVLDRHHDGPDTGVFTDGSASGNPGPGGWGAVHVEDGVILGQACGDEGHTTNNRMELTAMIEGCRLVPEGREAVIYSDSQLAVKTVNEWAAGWERRGWKRKEGPVKNLDLVKELWELHRARPELEFRWLRGHSGSRWNEYADALATRHARRRRA